MNDNISRTDVINAIKCHAREVGTNSPQYQLAHQHLLEVVEILPSATCCNLEKPERPQHSEGEAADCNLDCISREAAIEAINHICPVDTEYDCTLLDRVDVRCVLSDLPSAQPEPTLEQIEEYCHKRCLVIMTYELYNEMTRRWSSVRPEIIHCKNCMHWDELLNLCKRTKHMALGVNGFCSKAERRNDVKADKGASR